MVNWQNERKYYVFDVYVNYRPFPDSKFWSVFVLIRNVENNSVIQLFKNQQAKTRRFRQLFQINELCLNSAKISKFQEMIVIVKCSIFGFSFLYGKPTFYLLKVTNFRLKIVESKIIPSN